MKRFRIPSAMSALSAVILLLTSLTAAHAQLPTIRRTHYGVPHILANDFREFGIGLGYTMVEDYGNRVLMSMLRARGDMGITFGRDSMQSDFGARLDHERVRETYHLLDADTRDVLEGFAEGVNIYIRTYPDKVPAWAKPVFHGHDVAAMDIGGANVGAAQRVALRQLQRDSARAQEPEPDPDEGSNAWAFAPSRTKSGRAILLRNPHLAWNAGYWEAHVTIPGKLNFYGDFRIGGPFAVVGGFNEHLGFATTNNQTDTDEVYVLDADTTLADHYLFDGVSAPLIKRDVTVEYKTDTGTDRATQSFWYTPLGPVAYRTRNKIYIVRAGTEGEYRAGEQFLRMMKAKSLNEWKDALATRARPTSNFTYADRAGNILYIWNGSVPRLPHAPGYDSIAFPAKRSNDIWNRLIAFDSLPQVLNPKGGYVHNENDAPYYANLNAVLDTAKYPPNVERPRFGLRGQHAVQLIHKTKKLSLEDVVSLKHSYRMLLADRVKEDLIKAARASAPDSSLAEAINVLARWDNRVAPESRGALLFETWWRRYQGQTRDSAYAQPWIAARFNETPAGIGKPDRAVEALKWAVPETIRRFGALDTPWGDVHRVRQGTVDVPVGGCTGAYGCFRVLSYTEQPDGKRAASTGDGWVLAVEFTDTPRAYSVLAYGQSSDPANPHHADQAELFAKGQMKRVAFTEKDIAAALLRSYKPGER